MSLSDQKQHNPLTHATGREVRLAIREKRHTDVSRGVAMGYVQCNLVIIPRALAFDFMLYCQRNPKSCPLLEVTDPGNPEPRRLAPGADLRTDLARYAIYRNGERQPDVTDARDLWRDDLVGFLIGSAITFDQALQRAGVPTHKDRWVLRSSLPTEPAGRFRGNMAVTMRWLTPQQAITATQVSARFPFNHGAPLHVGDPAEIGADLKNPLFGPPIGPIPSGLIALFWACGVTPQIVAEAAKIELMIAHAPAYSFVTDIKADQICMP